LPAAGPVDYWRPATGPGVRIDAGIATGGEVSPFYDPMLAKVIAHGETRDEARLKLVSALKNTALFGVKTNKQFLIDALQRTAFVNGDATTAFIADAFNTEDVAETAPDGAAAAIASVILFCATQSSALKNTIAVTPHLLNWSSATSPVTPYQYGPDLNVNVEPAGEKTFLAHIEGKTHELAVDSMSEHEAAISFNGESKAVLFNIPVAAPLGSRIHFSTDGRDFDLTNLNAIVSSAADAAGAGAVTAPMHGLLVDVFVKPGETVSKGRRLAILEAMKMQHELVATVDGDVKTVHAQKGAQIAADTLILEIDVHDNRTE
jgi:geranyl-CoA carboxylase alpha subunit